MDQVEGLRGDATRIASPLQRRLSVTMWSVVAVIGMASLVMAFVFAANANLRPAISRAGIPVTAFLGIFVVLFLWLQNYLEQRDLIRRIKQDRRKALFVSEDYEKNVKSFRSKFAPDQEDPRASSSLK